MHVMVPLCMMTWSKTLVYCCECVFLFCFTLLLCECFFLGVLCCLVVWCLLLCFIFRCNGYRDWISGMNMCVCWVSLCKYWLKHEGVFNFKTDISISSTFAAVHSFLLLLLLLLLFLLFLLLLLLFLIYILLLL